MYKTKRLKLKNKINKKEEIKNKQKEKNQWKNKKILEHRLCLHARKGESSFLKGVKDCSSLKV